jgi:Flp pilus assembly protein TadD
LREKVLGVDYPSTLDSMNNLALVLRHQGKYDEAEKMHRQELELIEKMLGIDYLSMLDSMNNLALVLRH